MAPDGRGDLQYPRGQLRGLPDRLVAELLYGLWAHTQDKLKARPQCLHPFYDRLRAHQVRRLEEVTDPAAHGHSRQQVTMIRTWQRALRLLNATSESERVKDVWDMAVFGYSGHLPFTSLLQEPLREATKNLGRHCVQRQRAGRRTALARALRDTLGAPEGRCDPARR